LKRFLLALTLCLALPSWADNTIDSGTPLVLRLNNALSSETTALNQIVLFDVAETIYSADKKPLISAGNKAKGVVTFIESKAGKGMGGAISVTFKDVTADNGQKIPLSGSLIQKGKDKALFWSTFFWGPTALMRTGEDAVLQSGQMFTAYTDGPTTLRSPEAH
jgi:hypothetical protein